MGNDRRLDIKVGMRCICMINITRLVEYDLCVVRRNSLKSLGEISGWCLSWSGRNSMTPVSGSHGGAPSI